MMEKDPLPRRRSIRLQDYDYTQAGVYFVTIVTQGRMNLFGEVVDGEMRLSKAGRIVLQTWQDLPKHYPHVVLDEFIVMPNHVHGIIMLADDDRRGGSVQARRVLPENVSAGTSKRPDEAQTRPYPRQGLSEIVRGFKSFSARNINYYRRTPNIAVWQRSFYDHILRDDRDLDSARQYILNNPVNWSLDQENPSASSTMTS